MHNGYLCNYSSTRRQLKRRGVSERTIRFLFRDSVGMGTVSEGDVLVLGASATVLKSLRFQQKTKVDLSWLNEPIYLARQLYEAINLSLMTGKLQLTPETPLTSKWFLEFGYALTTQVSRVTTHLPDRLQVLSLALEVEDPNTQPYVEDCIAQLTESDMNSVIATLSLIESGNESLAVHMYAIDLETEKLTTAGKFKKPETAIDTVLNQWASALTGAIDAQMSIKPLGVTNDTNS